MSTRHIWKRDTRPLLYRRLVEKFGAYSSWENASFPSHALREEYENFIESFALVVGAKSATAVKHQIAYATNGNSAGGPNVAINLMNNISAAVEAGFIRWCDVPSVRLVRDEPLYGKQPRENVYTQDIIGDTVGMA